MRQTKSWTEKLHNGKERKLVPIPDRMRRRLGEGTLLVPTLLDVDAAIRQIPAGQVMKAGELRRNLAEEYGGDTTCPLCVGMFLRIVAEAAEERGGRDKTPYWRVVRDDGSLNPKLPGGVVAQGRKLRAEGITFDGSCRVKPAAANASVRRAAS